MGVENDQLQAEPSRIRRLIESWFSSRNFSSVDLCINTAPPDDCDEDYTVLYEIGLKPDRLEQSCAEIWITTEGRVGIAFERWSRVARRMGVVCRRDRFVGGYEPKPVSDRELIAVLDAIAAGVLAVLPVVIPFVGLSWAHTLMRSVRRSEIGRSFEGNIDWVHAVDDTMWRLLPILEYEAWDSSGA